ncbi:MAG: tetratricopeptide repeat protein [Candidatus Omnitrophota bacterium]
MKNLSRFVMGVLVFTLAVFSFGFVAGEVVLQKKLDIVKQRIPNQWWNGGWDEEADLQDIIAQSGKDKSQKAQAQYYIAGQYYSNREHQKALQEYRKLIKDYPDAWLECQKAQFEIGQINLYRLNEPEEAIYEYRKIIDNYENSFMKPKAQLMIARAYRKQQQYDSALKEYSKVLELYPEYSSEVTETHLDIAEMKIVQAVLPGVSAVEKETLLNQAILSFKKAYEICPLNHPEFMERALDGVCRAFRCLDMNLVRANNFVKFQKYGAAGADGTEGTDDDLINPLEEIKS